MIQKEITYVVIHHILLPTKNRNDYQYNKKYPHQWITLINRPSIYTSNDKIRYILQGHDSKMTRSLKHVTSMDDIII